MKKNTFQDYGLHSKFSVNDKRQEKWKKQRESRGFDSTELWNIQSTLGMFMAPRLKAFLEESPTYPHNMTKKQWHKKIKKMILAFEIMSSDDFYHLTGKQEKQLNKGWQLFKKHMFKLWW